MLLAKKYNENDIVSFKLVTGDEIVASIIEETDLGFEVNRPCTVMPGPQGMGLIQSLFTADADRKILLNKVHVVMHAPSVDAMQTHYIKTTTGIEPITRGGIIT
jgi:hypothetical protein